jgi:hypothetical protein
VKEVVAPLALRHRLGDWLQNPRTTPPEVLKGTIIAVDDVACGIRGKQTSLEEVQAVG